VTDLTTTEVVSRLLHAGLSAATVSQILGLEPEAVAAVEAEVGTNRLPPDGGVVDVRQAMQALGMRIIEETMVMLDESSPAIKQRLLTQMFAKMLPLMSDDATTGTDELRSTMMEMFASMRSGVAAAEPTHEELEQDQ
jgi:hypothetical protein